VQIEHDFSAGGVVTSGRDVAGAGVPGARSAFVRSCGTFLLFARIALFACAVMLPSGALAASYEYWLTGNAADAKPATTRAGLFLSCGGGDVTAAWKWFVACAGGGDIVILRASGGDGYNDYLFTKIGGVDSVETIKFNDASAAHDPRVLGIIAKADGIFMGGGDQGRYVTWWKDTPGQAARRHQRRSRRARPILLRRAARIDHQCDGAAGSV